MNFNYLYYVTFSFHTIYTIHFLLALKLYSEKKQCSGEGIN